MRGKRVGEVYGEWTILSKEGRYSICKCSCGTLKRVESGSLGTSSNSCGHVRTPGIRDKEGQRTCTACRTTKPVSEYHKDSGNKSGYRSRCKQCVKQYDDVLAEERARRARERYAKNPSAKIAKTSAYRRLHPEYGYLSRRVDRYGGKIVGDATPEALLHRLHTVFSNKCYICGITFEEGSLHWDHYRPVSSGGDHSLENLWAACQQCNQRKNARWPFTEEMKRKIAAEVRASRTTQAGQPVLGGMEV